MDNGPIFSEDKVSMGDIERSICGTESLKTQEISLVAQKFPELENILGHLISAIPGLRAYRVSYQYGAEIIGRRHKYDSFSKFLPPCFENDQNCQICKELAAETSNHRPLLIVLNGAGEEYYALPGVSDAGIRLERAVPYNICWPGQMPGLIEALNVLVIPEYGKAPRMVFDAPIRRLVAGARSLFLTVPLEDARLAKLVKKIVAPTIVENFYPGSKKWTPERFSSALQHDHSRFLQMLCKAAQLRWETSLLVIPVEQLIPMFQSGSGQERPAFALLKEAWIKTRDMRSDHIRQAALYAAMQSVEERDLYSDMTIHHLFSIARGYFPGFAPLGSGSATGPFSAIQDFLKDQGFQRAGLKWFPTILQPAHLGRNGTNSVYYSFQYPTLFAPVYEYENRTPLAKVVKSGLETAREESLDLAPGVEFDFFQAQGRPLIPGIPTFKTDKHLAPPIKEDFRNEIERAKQLWNLKDDADFFPGGKKGFLSRFVRVSRSS